MRAATIYNFLVEATLIGTVMILLMLPVRYFLRRWIGNRVVWAAWLLIALRLLVPLALPNPLMNELKPTLSGDVGIRPMADQVRVRVGDAASDVYQVAVTDAVTEHGSASWNTFDQALASAYNLLVRYGLVAYLTVAGLLLMLMLYQNLRFRRKLIRQRVGGLTEEENAMWTALCREHGLRRPLAVWRVENLPSACLSGAIHPVVALPQTLPPEQLYDALLHELCHHVSRDNAWGVLRNLCCAVHWFNPIVWVGAHLSRMDSELACDERVALQLSDEARQAYARMLIQASITVHATPSVAVTTTCMTMKGRHLKTRIRNILHLPKVRRSALVAFGLVCAMTAAAMFATAEQSTSVNVPTLPDVPAVSGELFAEALDLTVPEHAKAFARTFFALSGVNAGITSDEAMLQTKDEAGWYIEAYSRGAALPCELQFTEDGRITRYNNGNVFYNRRDNSVSMTDTTEEEKRAWAGFVTAFIHADLPSIEQDGAVDSLALTQDIRTGDERYMTWTTLREDGTPTWRMVVEAAPVGRIVAIDRLIDDSELIDSKATTAVNTAYPRHNTYVPQEVDSAYLTQDQAIAAAQQALIDLDGLTAAEVEALTITDARWYAYDDSQSFWAERNMDIVPTWLVCFSLGDPRTPYDYSVILNAATGEVFKTRNPSNIGNG